MVLQSTGRITFANIRDEMGSAKFSTLYAGAGYTPANSGVPSNGRIRVSDFYNKVKWTYPSPTYPVVQMVSTNPGWNLSANPDEASKFIWVDPYQHVDFPVVNFPITYYYIWRNTTGAILSAKLYVMQDDHVTIYMNDQSVTSLTYSGAYQVVNLSVPIGSVIFKFVVTNTGGPGGFTAVLRNTANTATYFYTDSSWYASHAYFVHERNWYTTFTVVQNGSYAPNLSGTDPNKQYQLASASVGGTNNQLYNTLRMQDKSSFVMYFEIYIPSGAAADSIYFFCGAQNRPGSEDDPQNGFILNFDVFSGNPRGRGIFLINGVGEGTVRASDLTTPFMVDEWRPVKIKYTKGTTNTWVIDYNNTTLFTYSDPNNASWVSSDSGSYWGIGSRTGGSKGDYYIRKLFIYYQ